MFNIHISNEANSSQLRNVNKAYIIECSNNSNGYYIKYSNGLIKQWGTSILSNNQYHKECKVIFPIAFKNLSSISINATSDYDSVMSSYSNLTTSEVFLHTNCKNGTSNNSKYIKWEVIGY